MKEEIKEVNEWFDNDIESPCKHCTSLDRIVIEECQALLNESDNGKVIFKPATVVADIASVCVTQWMNLRALEMFTKIVNKECKIGKVLSLNKIHNIDQIKTDLTDIGKDSLQNRKNDLILIMTPEKQDKTLELSKHWSVDSTPARNEVIMKRTYPVKSVKCDKIYSNY